MCTEGCSVLPLTPVGTPVGAYTVDSDTLRKGGGRTNTQLSYSSTPEHETICKSIDATRGKKAGSEYSD